MWKSKKLILVLVLAVLLVAGGTTGVVLAADGDGTQPVSKKEALLDRALEIYNENSETDINPEQLKDALAQARKELRDEAVKEKLDALVLAGKITQEQADELLEWWTSRPDITLPGIEGKVFGDRMMGGKMGGRGFGPMMGGKGSGCGGIGGQDDIPETPVGEFT